MRSVPVCPKAPPPAPREDLVSRTYRIHVVTPLFGGGPEAGKNDPVTLIRGASVRGQLRFWWRAGRGARIPTADKLREREGEIWGTSTSPSPVALKVALVEVGEQSVWAEYRPHPMGGVRSMPTPKPGFPAYALFPFKGEVKRGADERNHVEKPPARATFRAAFDLTLTFPAGKGFEEEVEAAVWAWVNFGGLGARTRRGCGSLYCAEFAARDGAALDAWYQESLRRYGIELPPGPRDWPTLPAKLLVKPGARSPREAWEEAVKAMNEFRQGPNVGRNPGQEPNRPGRSRWPEPDSLRRIMRAGEPRHKESITTPQNAFPRAEFGLPIVFHFKDRGDSPCDSELYPVGATRMASPVILKALALAPDRAVPVVICLVTKPVTEAELKARGRVVYRVSEREIRRPDLAAYNNSPLFRRSKAGSALEAFLNFAKEEGFR